MNLLLVSPQESTAASISAALRGYPEPAVSIASDPQEKRMRDSNTSLPGLAPDPVTSNQSRPGQADDVPKQLVPGRFPLPSEAKGRRPLGPLCTLLLLFVLLSGCARPTPANSPMPLPDSYILADDFSHPNTGWARFDTDESAVYAVAGELFLEDRGKGTSVYTPLIGHDVMDVVIDVDVRHVQGSVNNWMGVLCRQQDEDNYYLLAISADGYYLILRALNGEATPLVGPEFSEAIRVGKAENGLRARCRGSELSLWVNNERLATYQDDSLLEAGSIALFADAAQRGEIVVVAFDDFVMARP